MKGSFFTNDRTFELLEYELPAPGPDEVVIRVKACGICGTDIHIQSGEKGSADVSTPVILGHELAGIIEETGQNVSHLKVGDRVAVDPNIYCGNCFYCRQGKKQLCKSLQAIGINRNGGFAEYCVCPAAQCHVLGPDVLFEHGAMSEPLACCIHGIDRARIQTGDIVFIIGGGSIGLLMVQLAKLAGASSVILSEPHDKQREAAYNLGADLVINPVNEDVIAKTRALTRRDGADVVIECVGRSNATEQAFAVAAPGATILLFSVPKPDAVYELGLMDAYKKELRIISSFINPDTHQRAVSLINNNKIRFDTIITHEYPLNQLGEAFAMQRNPDSIKVMIKP